MTKPTLIEAMEIGIKKRPKYQFAYFGKCGTVNKFGLPTGELDGPIGSCALGAAYEGRFGYPKGIRWKEDGEVGYKTANDLDLMNELLAEYPELGAEYQGERPCECKVGWVPTLHQVIAHLNTDARHIWTREEIVIWLKKVGYK